MKKILITLTSFSVLIAIGVFSWSQMSRSAIPDASNSKYAEKCSAKLSSAAGDFIEYNSCCLDYNTAIDAVETDWQSNLINLVDQEKPASEMVGEAYENVRTYNCWLEYICRAVQYSGYAPIESSLGTGLTSEQIGVVPGCQKPENLNFESEYGAFVESMKEVPILGVGIQANENYYVNTKMNFFPRCMSDANNNNNPQISLANANFQGCKLAIEEKFGCSEEEDNLKECLTGSKAMAVMNRALKESNAKQKAGALESKLSTIVNKLNAMEEHVGYFSNFLEQLDSRFACYAKKCS